jgi:hypothetical protein
MSHLSRDSSCPPDTLHTSQVSAHSQPHSQPASKHACMHARTSRRAAAVAGAVEPSRGRAHNCTTPADRSRACEQSSEQQQQPIPTGCTLPATHVAPTVHPASESPASQHTNISASQSASRPARLHCAHQSAPMSSADSSRLPGTRTRHSCLWTPHTSQTRAALHPQPTQRAAAAHQS